MLYLGLYGVILYFANYVLELKYLFFWHFSDIAFANLEFFSIASLRVIALPYIVRVKFAPVISTT